MRAWWIYWLFFFQNYWWMTSFRWCILSMFVFFSAGQLRALRREPTPTRRDPSVSREATPRNDSTPSRHRELRYRSRREQVVLAHGVDSYNLDVPFVSNLFVFWSTTAASWVRRSNKTTRWGETMWNMRSVSKQETLQFQHPMDMFFYCTWIFTGF